MYVIINAIKYLYKWVRWRKSLSEYRKTKLKINNIILRFIMLKIILDSLLDVNFFDENLDIQGVPLRIGHRTTEDFLIKNNTIKRSMHRYNVPKYMMLKWNIQKFVSNCYKFCITRYTFIKFSKRFLYHNVHTPSSTKNS